MAINPFTSFVFDLFILSAIIITAYTINFYYLAFLSRKRKEILTTTDWGNPSITIQLPIYNEKYVAKNIYKHCDENQSFFIWEVMILIIGNIICLALFNYIILNIDHLGMNFYLLYSKNSRYHGKILRLHFVY